MKHQYRIQYGGNAVDRAVIYVEEKILPFVTLCQDNGIRAQDAVIMTAAILSSSLEALRKLIDSNLSYEQQIFALRTGLKLELVQKLTRNLIYQLCGMPTQQMMQFCTHPLPLILDQFSNSKEETEYIVNEYIAKLVHFNASVRTSASTIISEMDEEMIGLLISGWHVRKFLDICTNTRFQGINRKDLAKALNTAEKVQKFELRRPEDLSVPPDFVKKPPKEDTEYDAIYDDTDLVDLIPESDDAHYSIFDARDHGSLMCVILSHLPICLPSIGTRDAEEEFKALLLSFTRDELEELSNHLGEGVHYYPFTSIIGPKCLLSDHPPYKAFIHGMPLITWNISHREGARNKEGWTRNVYDCITVADVRRFVGIIEAIKRMLEKNNIVFLQECDALLKIMIKDVINALHARSFENHAQMIILPESFAAHAQEFQLEDVNKRAVACVVQHRFSTLLFNVHIPISNSNGSQAEKHYKAALDTNDFAVKVIAGDFNAVAFPSYGGNDRKNYKRSSLYTPGGFHKAETVPLAASLKREIIDHVFYCDVHYP